MNQVNTYKQDEEMPKFSFSNLSRMMKFVKPYWKDVILAFFIGLAASVLLLFIPKIVAYAVDVSFVAKNLSEIILLTLLMLVIVFVSTFLMKKKRDKLLIVLDKVSHDLKVEIFQKLQYLPNSFFDTRSHGKIYTRATTYPDEASAILCYVFVEILLDLINLIFVMIFMLTTNVPLSLISIMTAFLLALFFIAILPIRRRIKHKVNDKISNLNAYISESVHGVKVTQSFNREEKNTEIMRDLELEKFSAVRKAWFIGNLNWSLTGMFEIICMAVIYYVGLRYFYPVVPIGVIIAVDSYSSRFWSPISHLMSSYEEITEASVYLERIFELLDEDLVISDSATSKKMNIQGNVEFCDVSFAYVEGRNVLEHLNLSIEKGQKIGLVGETGSGKSTILSLISRFYDVTDGSILIDGVDVRDIQLDSLRGQVSVMLQDNFLFARSVYDNLVLDHPISFKKVQEVCKMLGIHDMIMKLENGYDTILLNNGSNLSSGERQLLCIARIMIQNPKILILDEATSNIDLKTEKQITQAMSLLMEGRTTILVAHRISTVRDCDKIFLIKDKKVYEEGSHLALMRKKGAYYKLYTSQSIEL